MVLDSSHFASCREQVVKMATPTSRIVAVPIAAHFCPIQNPLNSASDSSCGFGLSRPDGLENLHYQADVDGLDRQLSEYRETIAADSIRPLTRVLHITPTRSMGGNICFSALFER